MEVAIVLRVFHPRKRWGGRRGASLCNLQKNEEEGRGKSKSTRKKKKNTNFEASDRSLRNIEEKRKLGILTDRYQKEGERVPGGWRGH